MSSSFAHSDICMISRPFRVSTNVWSIHYLISQCLDKHLKCLVNSNAQRTAGARSTEGRSTPCHADRGSPKREERGKEEPFSQLRSRLR